MRRADRELLVARADVWAFVAEPFGRRSRETTLLVRVVEPYERFAWPVLSPKLDAEVSLAAVGPERTRVTVSVSRGSPARALGRLYGLLQTAATL